MRFFIATTTVLLCVGCLFFMRPAFAQPFETLDGERRMIDDLKTQRDRYLNEFGRNHPKVRDAEKRLERLEDELAARAKVELSAKDTQRMEFEALKIRVAELERRLERTESLFEKLTENLPAPPQPSVSTQSNPPQSVSTSTDP